MRPIRIVAIGGTRPEAIKFAPLMRVARTRADFDYVQVATGQHPEMFHQALGEFGLAADIDLALPNQDAAFFAIEAELKIAALLSELRPDLVLIQGDTSSAWAAAHAAHRLMLPIGHVEAGLRSGDPREPWPEERNRREIDALATLLFAPSVEAAANLHGRTGVTVTGNTGIDALHLIVAAASAPPGDGPKRILVTAHRGETIPRLDAVCDALLRIAEREDVRIRLPVHPNPAVRAQVVDRIGDHPRITLDQPLPYSQLIARLADSTLLLTDSGGLQEEAPALGIPTLVLRSITERPEVVASGNCRLVGLDAATIVTETLRLLDDPTAHAAMAIPAFPYGRGDAASHIADAIADWWPRHLSSGRHFP